MGDAVGVDDLIPVLGAAGLRMVAPGAVTAAPDALTAALQAAITALTARVAALEGRPPQVAHFTGHAKLPMVAVASPVTLTLTNLVPARTGDALKSGEVVTVAPAAGLPPGLNLSDAYVAADGTVSVQLSASVTVAAGATPVLWNVTALR